MADISQPLESSSDAFQPEINRLFEVLGLNHPPALSPLCRRILIDAVRSLPSKESERNVLSSTTVFLIAYLRSTLPSRAQDDSEVHRLKHVFASWPDINREMLDRFVSDFFKEVPKLSNAPMTLDNIDPSGLTIGKGLRAVLDDAAQALDTSQLLRSDQLVVLLLKDETTLVSRRVASARQGSPEAGRHIRMIREAVAWELTLSVEKYARAIATILRAASGEFSFVLFGRWGRGKTTLINQVKPLLEYPEEFQKESSAPKGTLYADLRYKVVLHNAWKYKTPPEAWVYLYKSLASCASASSGPLGRRLLALRTSIEKNGFWPLVGALVVLAFIATPIDAKARIIIFLCSVAGFLTVMHMAAVTVGVSGKVKELFSKNMELSSGDEKLGMLALIGDDVRALINAWTLPLPSDKEANAKPSEALQWRRMALPILTVAILSGLWAIGLSKPAQNIPWSRLSEMVSQVMPSLKSLLTEVVGVSALRETGPVDWVFWLLWNILAICLILLPKIAWDARPNRILLIIDDLDRCAPTEMLSVIEGVRLLLDDPKTNTRLQVIMLVDESVLRHAITERYKTMIGEKISDLNPRDVSAAKAIRSEIISEQIEKLFACHLRLSHLSALDVLNLVDKLAGYENAQQKRQKAEEEERRAKQTRTSATQSSQDATKEGRRNNPDSNRTSSARQEALNQAGTAPNQSSSEQSPPSVTTAPPFEEKDVRFSDAEIRELQEFVPLYFRSIHRHPSPRSIRALLFKIQLARLLLKLCFSEKDAQERSIKDLLADFTQVSHSVEPTTDEPDSMTIVRQVA